MRAVDVLARMQTRNVVDHVSKHVCRRILRRLRTPRGAELHTNAKVRPLPRSKRWFLGANLAKVGPNAPHIDEICTKSAKQ